MSNNPVQITFEKAIEKARSDERARFIEQACEAIRSQEVSKTFANDDYIEEWNMALESAEQAIRDRFNAASD